jgi:hypothetical protein
MIEALVSLRRQGKRLDTCAERIGVSYAVCREKARELGLAKHISRGPLTGEEKVARDHRDRLAP